jgi:hypothetical protein
MPHGDLPGESREDVQAVNRNGHDHDDVDDIQEISGREKLGEEQEKKEEQTKRDPLGEGPDNGDILLIPDIDNPCRSAHHQILSILTIPNSP